MPFPAPWPQRDGALRSGASLSRLGSLLPKGSSLPRSSIAQAPIARPAVVEVFREADLISISFLKSLSVCVAFTFTKLGGADWE